MEKKSLVQLFLSALLLSVNIILIKYILNLGVSPSAFVAASAFLSSIWVFVFIVLSGHKRYLRFPRKHILDLVLIGLATSVLGSLLGLTGLHFSTATNLALLRLTPFVVAILAYFILHERLTRQFWALLVSVFLGILLLSTEGRIEPIKKGDALIILSSIFYGFGSVWSKRTMANVRPLVVLLGRYFFGSLILVPSIFIFAASSITTLNNAIFYVVSSSFLTAIWTSLAAHVVEQEGPSLVNAFLRVTPVPVAVLAFFFLGETLSYVQLVGAALILASGFKIARLKAVYLPA